MNKIYVFLAMMVLFASLAAAADCNCPKDVYNHTETKLMPYDLFGDALEELEIVLSSDWNEPARIINPNEEGVNISLKIHLTTKSKTGCNGSSDPLEFTRFKHLSVPANSEIELPTDKPVANEYCDEYMWTGPYEVEFKDSAEVEVRDTEVKIYISECFKCPGEPCGAADECIGGFCVEGHCSNSELCFNGDCRCPEDEVQCDDGRRCVKRVAVAEGEGTICGMNEECISGYIDPETQLCSEKPEGVDDGKEGERDKGGDDRDGSGSSMSTWIIILLAVVVVGLVGYIFYTMKKSVKKPEGKKEEKKEAVKKETRKKKIGKKKD